MTTTFTHADIERGSFTPTTLPGELTCLVLGNVALGGDSIGTDATIQLHKTFDTSPWSLYDVYTGTASFVAGPIMARVTCPALAYMENVKDAVEFDVEAHNTLQAMQGSRLPKFYGLWRGDATTILPRSYGKPEIPAELLGKRRTKKKSSESKTEVYVLIFEDIVSGSPDTGDYLRKVPAFGADIADAYEELIAAGVLPRGGSFVRRQGDHATLGFVDLYNAVLRGDHQWKSQVAKVRQTYPQLRNAAAWASEVACPSDESGDSDYTASEDDDDEDTARWEAGEFDDDFDERDLL